MPSLKIRTVSIPPSVRNKSPSSWGRWSRYLIGILQSLSAHTGRWHLCTSLVSSMRRVVDLPASTRGKKALGSTGIETCRQVALGQSAQRPCQRREPGCEPGQLGERRESHRLVGLVREQDARDQP